MNKHELLTAKLTNFKNLVRENIPNKENDNYQKIDNYSIDDLIYFATTNLPASKIMGMNCVVESFFYHLELDTTNTDLKAKIQKYFEFLHDILSL